MTGPGGGPSAELAGAPGSLGDAEALGTDDGLAPPAAGHPPERADATGSPPVGVSIRAGRLSPWRLARRVARRPLDAALRLVCVVAAALQFLDLLRRSSAQYKDYALTVDFATFYQAWWQLGRGNLDPYDTLAGHPFWKDQFNLILWPLALLHVVSSSPFTLLVVQDLCIALSTLLAVSWVHDAAAWRLPRRPVSVAAIVLGSLAMLLLDPYAFETAYFDFHAETIMLVFLLLAGRALWKGKRRSPLAWGLLACLCCSLGSVLTVGLGVGAAVSGPSRRRAGLTVALLGLAMVGLVVALGANTGTQLGPSYGYLAGRTVAGDGPWQAVTIFVGALTHPGIALHTLWSRRGDLGSIVGSGGVVGWLSGFGVGVVLLGLLANALNVSATFVALTSGGFQSFPLVVFLTVGSALVVAWALGFRRASGHRATAPLVRNAGRLAGLATLAVSLLVAAGDDPGIGNRWLSVWPPGVQMLAEINALVPASDEVVVSQGVVGRFAGRADVVPYIVPNQRVPLRRPVTWFVISPAVGIEPVPAAMGWQALSALQTRYHGLLAVSDDGVAAVVVWRSRVPGGVVDLPPAGAE